MKKKEFKIGDEVSGQGYVFYDYSSFEDDSEDIDLLLEWAGKIVFIDTKGTTASGLPYLVQIDPHMFNSLPVNIRNELSKGEEGNGFYSHKALKQSWKDFETKVKFPTNLDKDGFYQWYKRDSLNLVTEEIRMQHLVNSITNELNN